MEEQTWEAVRRIQLPLLGINGFKRSVRSDFIENVLSSDEKVVVPLFLDKIEDELHNAINAVFEILLIIQDENKTAPQDAVTS